MAEPLTREQASFDHRTPASALREEDQRIMTLAASMDQEAQRAVAARLFGRVSRLVRMLLGNAADAEDATQLSLVEILRSAGGFRGESSLEHWADRVTVRTALRVARKRRESESYLDQEADLESLPEVDDTSSMDRERAARLLSQLSPPLREVVVLRHVMGHSVTETARELDVSPNTVKDRLVRARQKLRSLIRRDEFLRDAKWRGA